MPGLLGLPTARQAGLGTSPVAAIPYTLSLIFTDLSFGNWLIIFCLVQIIAQIIMLRKRTIISEIVIQVILAFAYGYLTDFSLLLLKDLEPISYISKVLFLLIGCVILAFGVYLELLGDVGMLSGDAFIKAIAIITNKDYGNVKIITDVSMSVLSAVSVFRSIGNIICLNQDLIINTIDVIKNFSFIGRRAIEGRCFHEVMDSKGK